MTSQIAYTGATSTRRNFSKPCKNAGLISTNPTRISMREGPRLVSTLNISRSNIARYWTYYERKKIKSSFRLWRHPIPHPYGRVNSLWPSDVIWRQGSGSTLPQVMACCLTAPSHYLNQCWFIISKVHWHPSEGSLTKDTSAISNQN